MAEIRLTEVRNVKGSSNHKPKDGDSWMKTYSDNKKVVVSKCSNSTCRHAEDLVGAHVVKTHPRARRIQYIVPLCAGCNHINDSFKVPENHLLKVEGHGRYATSRTKKIKTRRK